MPGLVAQAEKFAAGESFSGPAPVYAAAVILAPHDFVGHMVVLGPIEGILPQSRGQFVRRLASGIVFGFLRKQRIDVSIDVIP